MIRFIGLLLVAMMFSGCASTMTTSITSPDGTVTKTTQPGSMFGPSSYDVGYFGMYKSFSDSKVGRADAIQKIECPDNETAAAYCNMSKMMGIAMMSMERFDVKAPTTGFDVLNKLTDSVVPVAGFYSLYKLGVAGVQGAGSSFGDNATLTNSMNHTNPTNTNIGSGTATSNTSGTMPAADPLIVEPSYPPTESGAAAATIATE
jgi:hypothetical protein